MCVCVPEKQQWEEAEIDKMIIGPFYTEDTERAPKYPPLNLDVVSVSRRLLRWKKQTAALQMLSSSFQQEGQDVL